MNEVQTILWNMYQDVTKILEDKEIPFYLLYGSAIGAVRHNGFIPWDDDIDIGVFEEDLPAISKALTEELDSSKYYYHTPSADTHPHIISLEYGPEGIRDKIAPFMDLFIIRPYPSKKFRSLLFKCCIYSDMLALVMADRFPITHGLFAPVTRIYEKLAAMVVDEGTDLTTIYSIDFVRDVFPKNYYGKAVLCAFEDAKAPLPSKNHDMLDKIYGEYMIAPPEAERSGAAGYPCSVWKDFQRDLKNNTVVEGE